ncbi:MAG: hypothetical protein JSW04_09115 [Desulfobacterales bacterium]|nr:MAG: hypothetical protein JSW04_09115 [Desulfobacterales bacterium]
MFVSKIVNASLSDRDLGFLIDTVSPDVKDKQTLKQILAQDRDFRNKFVGDKKVFKRVIHDDEIFLKISPILFFEILLRKTTQDFEKSSYTYEKSGRLRIPIFDSENLVSLLSNDSILTYLAHMLSTFTKIKSYTISFRVRDGIWHKVKFNDMDIESLARFSQSIEGEYRIVLYKRIADVCLFVLGIFPEYIENEYRYPLSGQIRSQTPGKLRLNPEKYEEEGRKFYKLVSECLISEDMVASNIFTNLHEHFQEAKKPLNFLAEHYLQYKKLHVFG